MSATLVVLLLTSAAAMSDAVACAANSSSTRCHVFLRFARASTFLCSLTSFLSSAFSSLIR
eukprot:3807184-Rhodomonas_salina.1